MIGIIIPPGEIKKMVEKTASHVAKNGSQFEQALIEIQQNKPQFSFLKKDNPYRAYYDHMVAEYSRKILVAQTEEQVVKQDTKEDVKNQVNNQQQAQFLQRVFQDIKQPDPDRFIAPIPEKMTKIQMAIIQHTAQFVAVNGKNFLIALSERQKNNPQFQFLRSSSDNNDFFKKLVDAYMNIINFGEKDIGNLQAYIESKDKILEICQQQYEYHRMKKQQNKGKKETEQQKNEVVVDWSDYQLVETIIFDDYKPRTGYSEEFKLNRPLFSNKNMEETIISGSKKKQLLSQCHICKKNILSTELTKHIKTHLSSNTTTPHPQNITEGGNSVDISQNLNNMSSKRPDIFGGDGQHIRKEEANNQDNQQKIIWDGQAPNLTRSTATSVMMKMQQQNIKEQLKESQKQQ